MDTRNDRANRKYNNLFRLENELYHDIAVKMGLSDSAFGILYWLDDLGDAAGRVRGVGPDQADGELVGA